MYMGLDLIVIWMLYIKLKKYKNTDNFDSAIFGFNEYMLERLYSLTEDIQCAELQYIFIFLNKMPMIVLWLKIDRFFKFILFDRHL